METINRNLLSAALRKAMTEEHLWSHDTAKLLNINPVYVSMMLNPNSFEKAGSTVWKRVEDWHNTNDALANFKFPEGEKVWAPKEKAESKDYNIQSPKKTGFLKMKDIPVPPEKKRINGEVNGQINKIIEIDVPKEVPRIKADPDFKFEFSTLDKTLIEISNLKLQIEDLQREYKSLESYNVELHNANRILGKDNETRPVALLESTAVTQKLALDIEINLLVCGQKIQIKL